MKPRTLPPEERLEYYSELNPKTGCIEWKATILSSGYGQISVHGKGKRVHRYRWELEHGPIPKGMIIMHLCNNPACLNIDHLKLGTHWENSQHREQSDNTAKGERIAISKLKEQDVRQILKADKTVTHTALAKHYGVTVRSIACIRNRETWKHI